MKRIGLSLLTVMLFACGEVKESTTTQETVAPPMDIEKELAAITELRTEFTTALKEGRYEDIGKLVTPDAKTKHPGGLGWDEMFALGQERGRFPYDSIIMTPTETIIMNDSMAYDWGTSRVYYTNKDDAVVELQNSFLAILKRVDGGWKLHREVGSSTVE